MRGHVQHAEVWHRAVVACFGALLLCVSSVVQAASLGKIEVASPLGKALYAEVPLNLKANELASKVFIEIASAADYKIFEVYRDPILNNIRADVASDERGARVKLTSRIVMNSPFFNLVLKIRYGRVSHFKKFAVFLDSPKSIQLVADQVPVPHVEAIAPIATNKSTAAAVKPKRIESAGKALITQQDMQAANDQQLAQQRQPQVLDSWARTEKYGPIVRGDSLSVVARRLRVDQRYSTSQIMVALFEKNKASFNRNNLNLIKAKSFLKIPTAAEVEKHSKSEAYRLTLEHRKAWKQQPRYTVEAEVQRTRYSPRVRIGERADGQIDKQNNAQNKPAGNTAIAQAAMKPAATQDLLKSEQTNQGAAVASTAPVELPVVDTTATTNPPQLTSPALESMMQAQAETNQLLAALQQKNEQLQQQLIANKDSVDALNEKVDEGASAASNARVEKLEILLTRLQAELEKQSAKAVGVNTESLDWVIWLLLSLLIVMLGVIAMLMRKEPAHPSAVEHAAGFDGNAKQAKTNEPESAVAHLEEVVEKEVDAIETDEQEVSLAKATGTFDAMAAFTDELSDTDTAELEPFDVDAKQELDPNIDYLSEADVYIRYGMDDEALQQLDMALRLKPEHAEAHIKKAEVLHGKQDTQAFAAAVAAATAVLGATALNQFKAAVQAFGGDADAALDADRADESDLPMVDGIDTIAPVTMTIDDAEIDALDFDMTGLNGLVDVAATGAAETAVLEESIESTDTTIGATIGATAGETDQVSAVTAEQGLEELDWLNDPAFDDSSQSSTEIETVAIASGTMTSMLDEPGLLSTEGATQQLDSLLGEFAGDETASNTVVDMVVPSNTNEGSDALLSDNGATENLDGLLSEFTEQDDAEDALSHLDEVAATVDSQGEFEAGATQHLDSLLNEFTDDDDLNLISTLDDLNPAVIEQAQATSDDDLSDSVITVGADYGATQELDSLLAEFSADDDDDGLSFIEPGDSASMKQKERIETDLDHGATQELDSLLGEFANADDDNTANQERFDHGATQVLGHLLDEFSDDDEDKNDKKKS